MTKLCEMCCDVRNCDGMFLMTNGTCRDFTVKFDIYEKGIEEKITVVNSYLHTMLNKKREAIENDKKPKPALNINATKFEHEVFGGDLGIISVRICGILLRSIRDINKFGTINEALYNILIMDIPEYEKVEKFKEYIDKNHDDFYNIENGVLANDLIKILKDHKCKPFYNEKESDNIGTRLVSGITDNSPVLNFSGDDEAERISEGIEAQERLDKEIFNEPNGLPEEDDPMDHDDPNNFEVDPVPQDDPEGFDDEDDFVYDDYMGEFCNSIKLHEKYKKVIKDWCKEFNYNGPLAYTFGYDRREDNSVDYGIKVLNIYINGSTIRHVIDNDMKYCLKLETLFAGIYNKYNIVKIHDIGPESGFVYNDGTDVKPDTMTHSYDNLMLYDRVVEWCNECHYKNPVGYSFKNSTVNIYAERPGFLIGKAGIDVNHFTTGVRMVLNNDAIKVNFVELTDGGFIK